MISFSEWNYMIELNRICKMCHDNNNKLMILNGESPQVGWDMLDAESQYITYKSVKKIIDDPNITAECIHNEWMNNKKLDGWVYGEVKDVTKKTHPLIVPFDQLSEIDKQKDQSFIDIVRKNFKIKKEKL